MSRRVAVTAFLAACGAPPLLEHGVRPLQNVRSPTAELSASACESCHAESHEGWSTSAHARAYSDPAFQLALAESPQPSWCLNCHAPLPEQRGKTALRSEGITCVVCHARGGVLLSGQRPTREAQRAHPIRREPALTESTFCGGCHQFNLPEDHPMASEVPVQTTLTEWEASGSARNCQACHLDGHRFPGGHDEELVRSAITLSLATTSEAISLALSTDAPHNVPTGDPFRRLVWEVCADATCESPLARRVAARLHAGPSWHLVQDTTLTAARPIHWSVPRSDEAQWWQLWLYLGDPRFEAALAPEDVRLLIAEGPIEPPPQIPQP